MSWEPERGLSGSAVIALHVLALAALVGATRHREALVAATPLQVSIMPEAKPRSPDPAPRTRAPRLENVARELVPLPEIAIAAPAAPTAISASRTEPVAADPTTTAPGASAPPPEVPPAFDADYLANPAPAYPALSRRLNEEGKVTVRVLVTAEGRAERVEIARSSGYERLDRSALEAVARWRFVPARRGSANVAAFVLVPVRFVLRS